MLIHHHGKKLFHQGVFPVQLSRIRHTRPRGCGHIYKQPLIPRHRTGGQSNDNRTRQTVRTDNTLPLFIHCTDTMRHAGNAQGGTDEGIVKTHRSKTELPEHHLSQDTTYRQHDVAQQSCGSERTHRHIHPQTLNTSDRVQDTLHQDGATGSRTALLST